MLVGVVSLLLVGVDRIESWVPVSPSDPGVSWLGRVDLSVPASPRFAWSGSGFSLDFEGTGVVATLETFSQPGARGTDRYEVRVDQGQPVQLEAPNGEHELVLAADLAPGRHVLEVRKVTEAMVGTGALYALTLAPGGRLRNPHPGPPRRIEVVGGAETCGSGLRAERGRPAAEFTPEEEDWALAWPNLVGEALDAQLHTVCYSGRGLLGQVEEPGEPQLPDLWRRVLPHDSGSTWDFGRYVPDVVVLELGAHDLGAGRPSRRAFQTALDQWILQIRDTFPDAWIILVPSRAVTDAWPEGGWGPAWITKRFVEQVALAEGRGDGKLRVIAADPRGVDRGLEGPRGPAVHAALAREITGELREVLAW